MHAPLHSATVSRGARLARSIAAFVVAVSCSLALTATAQANRTIMFVVDTSGSMAGQRLTEAKQALINGSAAVPQGATVGLRSFGGGCSDGGVERVALGPFNPAAFAAAVNALTARGTTPTPEALRAAVAALPPTGERTIILVSDGQSTCGDPCPVAQQLAATSGVNFTMHTVGFRTAGGTAETELQCIARVTGGTFVSANDEAGLQRAIGAAASGPCPPKSTAKLALLRASTRGRLLDMFATITSLASGRAKVTYHAAARRTTFSIPIVRGRISGRLLLTSRQARLRTGILTLEYAGDADTRPQTVRLRAAPNRANLRQTRPRIVGNRLFASGTISRRASGVVRVQLEYQSGCTVKVINSTARIRNGRWSLVRVLTPAQLAEIAGRKGTVHSYTLFTGFQPRLIRGEMRSLQVLGPR